MISKSGVDENKLENSFRQQDDNENLAIVIDETKTKMKN